MPGELTPEEAEAQREVAAMMFKDAQKGFVGAILGEEGTRSAPVRQGIPVEEEAERLLAEKTKQFEYQMPEYQRQAMLEEEMREKQRIQEALETIQRNRHIVNEHIHIDGMEYNRERPGWDTYFLGMLHHIGSRATCNRGYSGCLIVKDNRILMSGYVGSPPGMEHCDDVGHEFEWRLDYDPNDCEDYGALTDDMHRHCIRTIHAEANAIYHCARKGVSVEGATIYCKMTPCRRCAEAIVQVGIARVVTEVLYHDAGPALQYFARAGVKISSLNKELDYKA